MQTLILNHYPPVIKKIRDIQQIAKAEDIEFSKLDISIKEVLSNMFIFTADEEGIEKFEKMLGIFPEKTQSLEERRLYIISRLQQHKMSLSELETILAEYSEEIRLIHDMSAMEMTVDMGGSTAGIRTIGKILEDVLPLNIFYHFLSGMNGECRAGTAALQKTGSKIKVKPYLEKKIRAEDNRGLMRASVLLCSTIKIKAET